MGFNMTFKGLKYIKTCKLNFVNFNISNFFYSCLHAVYLNAVFTLRVYLRFHFSIKALIAVNETVSLAEVSQ